MDKALAEKLRVLNNRFYEENAASFSATRKSPWNGWRTVVELLDEEGAFDGEHVLGTEGDGAAARSCRLLDIACGNLRFEEFLTSEMPERSFEFVGIDSCPALLGGRADVAFFERDVVGALCAGETLLSTSGRSDCATCLPFDVAVSFGFMHHLPTREMRAELLKQMLASLHRGGFAVISFWEFMHHDTLAKKARSTHAAAVDELHLTNEEVAQLDENDYFLGWNDRRGSYRYCHHFTSQEISGLLEDVADCARVIARFHADGRSGDLNEYVVLSQS